MARRSVVLVAILAVIVTVAAIRLWPDPLPDVPAWEPVEGFIRAMPDAVRQRHEYHLAWIRREPLELIFFGDSIARGWEDEGDLWQRLFASRRAGLFATSHDTTSNLLWRLDHGELDGTAPRTIVVLIGTNNRKDSRQSPADVARGIETIIGRIRAKQPQAKVLLLGILPQGRKPHLASRRFIGEVNLLISRLADGKTVFFRDHGPVLLDAAGQFTEDVSTDGTHLTRQGYERWAAVLDRDLAAIHGN